MARPLSRSTLIAPIVAAVLSLGPALAVGCSGKPTPPPCNTVAQPWTPASGAVAGQGSASAQPSSSASIVAIAPEFSIEQLLNVKRAVAPRAIDDKRFVYLSDAPGTFQIFEREPPTSPMAAVAPMTKQHTSFPDRISAMRVSPDGKSAVFLKDTGGDENDQIFRLTLEPVAPTTGALGPEKIQALTHAPKVKNTLPVFDEKGARIAYTSNARNLKDMDLFVEAYPAKMSTTLAPVSNDKAKVEPVKPLLELTGSHSVADLRGNQALVVEARSNVDQDLWIIDVKSKAKKLLTKHTGDERWESARFSRDGKTVFALTDAGREFMAVVAIDLASSKRTALVELDHDITGLTSPRWQGPKAKAKKGEAESELRAKTEDLLVYDVDVDGVEQIEVLRLDDKRKPLPSIAVKSDLRGVISAMDCDASGTAMFLSLERAEQPPEIYRVDLMTLQATRETQSDHAGVDESKLVPAQLLSYKTFDGKPISFFWYAKPPAPGAKLPVVIQIHGGPEAQAQPSFSAVTQYLALAGYAVAVPNVRGSMGYGKSFAHLDDKEKREDSVRDLSELGKFLALRPDVDGKKLVLFGGSYGGYMVLAGLTLYPEQWAAGVDIVGIANFRTFLEQTAAYRRALREAEYGALDKDGALLDKISPIHKVDKIAAPLMVIHGTRDPRVPIGEATQIAAALKKRGLPVELMTFDDEGHGLAKLKNRLIAYPAMVTFLDKYVKSK